MIATQWTVYIAFGSVIVILLCIGGMLKYQEKFDEDDMDVIHMDELLRNKPRYHPIQGASTVVQEEEEQQHEQEQELIKYEPAELPSNELECMDTFDQMFEALDETSCM